MTELTQEEVVRRGLKAAQVLASEDMVSFIHDYQSRCLEAIANTETHETKTRESNYMRYKAIAEVLADLNTYVASANQIIEAHETHKRDVLGDLGEPEDTD